MSQTVIKSSESIDAKCVNTIRALSLDCVEKAKSGHQGTAMALAPLAHDLYTRVLRHDPHKPKTFNRDRLVLSAGHASALLYSTLHLCGYEITLNDLKEFRQSDSLTPGHPEFNHTDGVEVTTGPLGQGFANAVGMAMAASFAGHNKLDNLIVIYDDNKITIDGKTDLTFSEDVAKRFASQGWNVIEPGEISEDLDAIESVINEAKVNTGAPTIIILPTECGFPSPKLTGSHLAHGNPFDSQEIIATKQAMGSSTDSFVVDKDVYEFYENAVAHQSEKLFDHALNVATQIKEGSSNSFKVKELTSIISGNNSGVQGLSKSDLQEYFNDKPKISDQIATRVSCANVLSKIGEVLPSLIGGSADLTGNTGTKINGFEPFSPNNFSGRQIHFGIREHAMAAIAVGMCAGYGLHTFTGTFFVFSDYMRPSIRLAALSNIPVLFVFSHDSIGVGEDGPTHQPVEQLASLRAMPNLNVVRPADAFETAAAIENHFLNPNGPTVLVTSRQNVEVLENTQTRSRSGILKGGYTLNDYDNPDITLVGSGSETQLCVQAAEELMREHKVKARVVSMISMNSFLKLSKDEQQNILGRDIPILSIEAASTFGWSTIADDSIGIDRFGASAPAGTIYEKLNISTKELVSRALKLTSK